MMSSSYLIHLLKHIRECGLEPGKLNQVEIRHEAGCAIWQGEPCDCEPEIETSPRVQRRYGKRYVP